MSTQYQSSRDVPSAVLAKRLDELAEVVSNRRDRIGAEFTIRIPAECDRDADLVMAEAASRLRSMSELVEALKAADDYLSDNPFNEIGSRSILHRQMKDALAAWEKTSCGK